MHSAGAAAKTKKMVRKAFETQIAGRGFSFVEILTMCPTGWFIGAPEGADYMDETLGQVHTMGELKGGYDERVTRRYSALLTPVVLTARFRPRRWPWR